MRWIALFLVIVSSGLHAQDTTRLSLQFLGDIMQHDSQISAAFNKETGTHDYTECFQYIQPVLEAADLTIGNLELTFAGPPYKGYPQFSAPDALLTTLKNVGIDILVTANNHSMDRGRLGVERTIHLLDSMQMPHTGTFLNVEDRSVRYPLWIEKNGVSLAILNYTYGTNGIPVTPPNFVNRIDTLQVQADLELCRQKTPDAIVVFFHWGSEYQNMPNEWQKKIAEFCFRNGAKLVIGSHPHVLQPAEWHVEKDQVVAYSLGNFVSGQRDRYRNGGTILQIELEKVAYDSVARTRVKSANYELQYVYRNAQRKYFILPARLFENDTLVVREEKERQQLKEFVADSRMLFSKNNIHVEESAKIYQRDTMSYQLVTDSLYSSVQTLADFYGVERDSIAGNWCIGVFYDLETAEAARNQFLEKQADLKMTIVRAINRRRERKSD
jgi:poly-gamma-glutamate synthesis protein (capsule biosynthesis protein)